MSAKLHSIPTEAFHEAPKEVRIVRDVGGDGEICLDEMGRPKGFNADAVAAKSSNSSAAPPHSNGVLEKAENGVEADHEPIAELTLHSSGQSEISRSQVELPKEEKEEEVPYSLSENVKVETEREEESPQVEDNSEEEVVQEKQSEEVINVIAAGGTKETVEESGGCPDDFGDFDSAFAPSSEQGGAWSATFPSDNLPPPTKMEDEGEDDFGDFTNSSLVTPPHPQAAPVAVADPDPSLESLQQILDSVSELFRKSRLGSWYVLQPRNFLAAATKDLSCDKQPLPVGLCRSGRL